MSTIEDVLAVLDRVEQTQVVKKVKELLKGVSVKGCPPQDVQTLDQVRDSADSESATRSFLPGQKVHIRDRKPVARSKPVCGRIVKKLRKGYYLVNVAGRDYPLRSTLLVPVHCA